MSETLTIRKYKKNLYTLYLPNDTFLFQIGANNIVKLAETKTPPLFFVLKVFKNQFGFSAQITNIYEYLDENLVTPTLFPNMYDGLRPCYNKKGRSKPTPKQAIYVEVGYWMNARFNFDIMPATHFYANSLSPEDETILDDLKSKDLIQEHVFAEGKRSIQINKPETYNDLKKYFENYFEYTRLYNKFQNKTRCINHLLDLDFYEFSEANNNNLVV